MIALTARASFRAVLMGLASIAAPALFLSAPAQAQQARGVLPADPQDFQCFVLMQQRRQAFIENTSLAPAQQAEFVNNLTIISAFYAGRISHYSAAEAVAQFRSASNEVGAASPEQRDAFANICTNFYVSVQNVLVTTNQQANASQQ